MARLGFARRDRGSTAGRSDVTGRTRHEAEGRRLRRIDLPVTTFFAENIVECARDGSNSALEITRAKRVVVSSDGLQIGPQRFPFASVLEMGVRGNVLSLTLHEESGRRVERSFRYDTFLPGTGRKRMAAVGQRIGSRLAATPAAPAHSGGPRAEHITGARYTVRVHASEVSFPPFCPVCLAPGTRAGQLGVSQALDRGNWNLRSSELTFSFDRPDYGERFLAQNTEADRPDPGAVDAALTEINAGTRFVLYTYAVSLLVVSFKRPTEVCVLAPGASPVIRGLPYTAVSLLCGWWGIPHGPIFTISSLVTNLRGGIDLTRAFAAVVQGRRLSATGV